MSVIDYYTIDGEIISENSPVTGRRDYIPDALGSVQSTAAAGVVENTYYYKPYGTRLARTGSAADPAFQWNGCRSYRSTTRVYADNYVRARHYAQSPCRWCSIDPTWPTEQAFTYVGCNPLSVADPSGLCAAIINQVYLNPRYQTRDVGKCHGTITPEGPDPEAPHKAGDTCSELISDWRPDWQDIETSCSKKSSVREIGKCLRDELLSEMGDQFWVWLTCYLGACTQHQTTNDTCNSNPCKNNVVCDQCCQDGHGEVCYLKCVQNRGEGYCKNLCDCRIWCCMLRCQEGQADDPWDDDSCKSIDQE